MKLTFEIDITRDAVTPEIKHIVVLNFTAEQENNEPVHTEGSVYILHRNHFGIDVHLVDDEENEMDFMQCDNELVAIQLILENEMMKGEV